MNRRCSAALLAGLIGSACLPNLEPITWELLDVEALRDAIAHPDGLVTATTANEMAHEIIANREVDVTLSTYFDNVFIESAPSEPEPAAPPTPAHASGTSLYALVACPGALLDASDVGFTHGTMRVDSGSIHGKLDDPRQIVDDMQLSFESCEIGRYVIDGVARAHHDPERAQILIAPALEVFDQVSGATGRLTLPMIFDWSDPVMGVGALISVLITLESGKTLVLEIEGTELRLRGSNGALVCTIMLGNLGCVPP